MTERIPEPARHEFRVWSEELEEVIGAVRAASQQVDMLRGRETYLMSAATVTVNPKVRDGVLDIKILVEEVDGFEQWDVHSKQAFPLSGEMVADLLTLLGAEPIDLPRDAYDLDQLLAEIVEPLRDLFAVDVVKEREVHTLGACRAEITVATIGGRGFQTVAIESADLAELAKLRTSLGLDGYANLSYPRAILETTENHGD